VDIDRAIVLTAFTRQTQVERVEYRIALPTVADDFALHHLPQHARAAASGMLFLQRGPIAWAHRAFFMPAAFAHANTAHGGHIKTVFLIDELEVRLWLGRMEIGAVAQVLVNFIWIDHLSRIHLPLRVPKRLEL